MPGDGKPSSSTRGRPGKSRHPRKRFYRARAHSNPLSDSHFPVPISPAHIDWSEHFPAFFQPLDTGNFANVEVVQNVDFQGKSSPTILEGQRAPATSEEGVLNCRGPVEVARIFDAEAGEEAKVKGDSNVQSEEGVHKLLEDVKVRFADVGCGFGGLLVKLSPMFPNTLMIGMELRDKVSEYVKERILALRKDNSGHYENVSIIRTNSMKYLNNYFEKGQLQKMFFLFPDPHFKERNHRRRVISVALLAEYAHVMAVGGLLYTITDVRELAEWMKSCLDVHPLFEEVSLQEQESDPVVKLLKTTTEEGQKVERNGGETFQSVYRRVPPHDAGA